MGEDGTPSSSVLKGVAWCRQVDNEAESPRHQSAPSGGFEGYNECLPRLRIVGDLAINLSDTSDYWDPDPRRRMSFYPSLFLYTAAKGRYLCLGRMFLSTEDRPRLGIKTLILDMPALIRQPQPATLLRKWYEEMGADGGEAPKVPSPSPALVVELARSLLYERGDAENPVMVALSREWSSSAGAVFSLLERAPTTLLALSGILVFPYYIPAGNVDYSIVSKTFPLSLAIFRMDANMTLDQRKRRLDLWAKKGVTLVDLTATPLKEPKRLSHPIQWLTDGKDGGRQDRLKELIDGPELARLLSGEMERDDGPYHRKEIARIYSKMESLIAEEKDIGKPASKKSAPTTPTPPMQAAPVPQVLGSPPPWTEREVVRVEKAGMVVGGSSTSRNPPPTAPVPAVGSEGLHGSREEMIRYLDSRIAEEIARVLANSRGPELEHLHQEVESLRTEVREMDERVKYFAERTLPVLKKTWSRIETLDKVKGTGTARGRDTTKEVAKLKEEVWQELHRMETDLAERSRHILERMESNLQSQGRIWLTLVQEISRLTRERHAQRIEEEEP